MEIEFVKQAVKEHISIMDEIVLYNCEEDMMNGPFTVAAFNNGGEVTLVGRGRNEGTICVIYVN